MHTSFGAIDLWHWGVDPTPDPGFSLVLSRVVRETDGAVSAHDVGQLYELTPWCWPGCCPLSLRWKRTTLG